MTESSFDLIPFPNASIPEIRIKGTIARERNIMMVHYSLSGETETILFPCLNPDPGRKDELWLSTCFEFFLAIPGRSPYWEFNLSPSGDWNVFRMDAYRQVEFREEELIQTPQLDISKGANCYQLEAVFDLSPILEVDVQILVAVSSVILSNDGHETYWALTHPSPRPDFHRRESFILALEG